MTSGTAGGASPCRRSRGFSLVELLVVIAVALILAALLLPVMTQLRENAQRLVCSSNERQVGMAMHMYASDWNENLPYSTIVRDGELTDLMAAFRGNLYDPEDTIAWDGLGLLYKAGYCNAPDCYYCPSHHGEHALEKYQNRWMGFQIGDADGGGSVHGGEPIFTNYHYAGDIDWSNKRKRRLDQGEALVLVTDGLRTALDFNHEIGMNILRGDGSVVWRDDVDELYEALESGGPIAPDLFDQLWNALEQIR